MCVSWKMIAMEFEFCKFSAIRSKELCLCVFEPTIWLVAQGTAHALRHRLGKQVFVKENEKKNIAMKETCQMLEIVNFFLTKDYLLLESCRLYVIVKYKASKCSVKLAFFIHVSEISKISVPATFDYTWQNGLPLHYDKIAVKHDV